MTSSTRRALLGSLVLVAACRRGDPTGAAAWVTVHLPPLSGIDPTHMSWTPESAARRAPSGAADAVTLERTAPASPLHLEILGACAIDVPPSHAGESVRVEAAPILDLGEDLAQVGFDAPFEVEVKEGCSAARQGKVEWRQLRGEPLPEMSVLDSGFRVKGRTRPAGEELASPPWGIVPVSPRTRGEATLEATWQREGVRATRIVTVASAARATGVPSVSVSQRVLLGGEGWRVTRAPPGSRAALVQAGPFTTLTPDVTGRWMLEDQEGNGLSLRAGLHDQSPLDCGRADCHAAAAHGAEASPMTHVLERALQGRFGSQHDIACTFGCHTIGEPGLRDGGFVDDARRVGLAFSLTPREEGWAELPRVLRRLGGVGCASCHGPGAIPERGARVRILASDVCATCHDAPPRYAYNVAWRSSRMARSDVREETRSDPSCARCHTTAGFLASLGVEPKVREPPAKTVPYGVACVACHAPHAERATYALLREVPLPPALGTIEDGFVPSRVCVRCHSPGEGAVGASAAALILGSRGDPEDPQIRPSAHRAVQGGCIGCHGAGPRRPEDEVHGKGHSFKVDAGACARCHRESPGEQPGRDGKLVRQRAADLRDRLRSLGVAAPGGPLPPHASARAAHAPGALARAAWNLALVLEDPAAGVHNAPFARALLDEVEDQLRSVRK